MQDYLLRVHMQVLDRSSQELITSFSLGDFENIRQAEKIRARLIAANPTRLFICEYKEIVNPNVKLFENG